jgi:hypothetical protein
LTAAACDELSPAEFAGRHGMNPETVRNWCRTGRIRARRVGPKLWRIPADAEAEVVVENAPPQPRRRQARKPGRMAESACDRQLREAGLLDPGEN